MNIEKIIKKTMTMTAAVILATITTASLLSGCSLTKEGTASAGGKELKEFNIGYLASTGHLLFFVAKEEGFFEEEGLDANLVKFAGATDILSAFNADKLDAAAIGSTQTVHYLQQGYPLTCIGGIMSEGHALLVKDSVLQGAVPDANGQYDLNLLKGKNIAVTNNGTEDIILRISLQRAGISLNDVNFVNEENGTTVYAAMSNAQIDGAYVFTPYIKMGQEAGYTVFQYSGDVVSNHPCCRNIVPTEKLDNDRDTYRAYLRAMIKAYRFYKNNQQKTVSDVLKYVELDENLIYQETYEEKMSINPDPEYDSLVDWYQEMRSLGYIDEFSIGSDIDSGLYKEALDEIVQENPDDADYQALEAHYAQYNQQ